MSLNFQRHILANGLTLLVHEDHTTPMAACNIVYKVGSRDENPDLTGIAHLFEHYMFCGSKHIADYDRPLQSVGAINNAYTSQDITHYYAVLPANNLETLLWLESDRMLELAFDAEQLEIQRNVVIEEFKEVCINRPFGDAWMKLSELTYQRHPYAWTPIGKCIEHVEKITMDDMKSFFFRYYRPNNAILVIAGNVHFDECIALAEKWFGGIPAGPSIERAYPQELPQTAARQLTWPGKVPYSLLLKSWRMCRRHHPDFYTCDLLTDLLGDGKNSYLYQNLVVKYKMFTDISASVSATFDEGMLVITGRPAEGVAIEDADAQLNKFLCDFAFPDSLEHDLQRVKNKVESILLTNEIKLEDRSTSLAVAEAIRRAEDFEDEKEHYFAVTSKQMQEMMHGLLTEEKSNTLFYVPENER